MRCGGGAVVCAGWRGATVGEITSMTTGNSVCDFESCISGNGSMAVNSITVLSIC